jgi:integrase
MTDKRRSSEGIEARHGRSCPALKGGACRCEPTYRAEAYDRRTKRKVRKSFPTAAAAKQWRSDAIGDVRRGKLKGTPSPTLQEAADAWLVGARDGSVRTRSGDVYKPSAIRGYEAALENRILPNHGGSRIADITRVEVQDLADRMLAEGLDPSSVRNTLMPLRVIYRRALQRGEVSVNPTTALELPAVRGRRERIASPTEACELLDTLPLTDRAVWATAMFGGLRRGELMGLRWEDVDLASGVIRVERSFDPKAGCAITPKSRAGVRSVPIAAALRDYLTEHKQRGGRSEGLVFGRTATAPFADSAVGQRARRVWEQENKRRIEQAERDRTDSAKVDLLTPIGLHECRHSYASMMIEAGVNFKALSTYMGHANISITLDRYGHLMPGNEAEAASLLDAYLERADTAARVAQLG